MKVSLICTVKNEDKNIEDFVDSIIAQTEKPEEFIIVDGGSEDKTLDLLKKRSKEHKWIRVLQENGANISRGRNLAIEKSKNEIIAVCDAGGHYRKDWLEKLKKGFNGEVSFGMEKPLIKNKFQEILAKKLLHKGVPGSSRNMIFSKEIWKDVGGYPEDLERAEDTLFDERIKKKGYKISRVLDAICLWEMRANLMEVRKQFYEYGYWDGVLERKYKMLPGKYKFMVWILVLSLPLYPLLWIISNISLGFRIDFVRRYAYMKGFLKGYYIKK